MSKVRRRRAVPESDARATRFLRPRQRAQEDQEEVVEVHPGVSLDIPVGTKFQFRCDGDEPLEAVGVTIPPWPGPDEAFEVKGKWHPTA